mmetsp:Transcript_44513/g.83480  ORF Transcript_44513/g.83480 Transcript_44513/m.83480 type:complete len:81 (+) Transcript_44513:240-482(+)
MYVGLVLDCELYKSSEHRYNHGWKFDASTTVTVVASALIEILHSLFKQIVQSIGVQVRIFIVELIYLSIPAHISIVIIKI